MKSLANMSNVMARFVPMGHWSRSSAFGRGKSCGCVIMRVQLKFEWSKGLSKILLPNKGHLSKNNADKDTTTSTPVLQEQIRLKQIVSATHPPWKSIQSHDLSLEIEALGLIQNVQWPPLIYLHRMILHFTRARKTNQIAWYASIITVIQVSDFFFQDDIST